MRVGSLFTGIGGLDLGAERAGMTVAWQSEINPFACHVLAKHWPDTPNLGDITEVDWSTVESVDVICGGYPCQPFSHAARGRNNAPDLWPHMRGVIAAVRPRFVVLENVAAHLNNGFAGVLGDLADLGFDAEWEVVTACAFGAPHRRRRLLAVAHAHGECESVLPVDGEASELRPTASDRREWLPAADDVRADDGVPDRVHRLRALGNAVVPAVAEHYFRLVMEAA